MSMSIGSFMLFFRGEDLVILSTDLDQELDRVPCGEFGICWTKQQPRWRQEIKREVTVIDSPVQSVH